MADILLLQVSIWFLRIGIWIRFHAALAARQHNGEKMTVNKRIWALFIALMIVMGGAYLWVRNPDSAPEISPSLNPVFFQFMGLTVLCVGVTGFAVINSYKKLFRKIILELDNLASGIEGASDQIKIKGTEGLNSAQRKSVVIDETTRYHGQIVDDIRPWWQRAMVGENFTSPVYISAIDNNPCRTISIPYVNTDRTVVGVIGADLKIG
jgi:hypothetical protein